MAARGFATSALRGKGRADSQRWLERHLKDPYVQRSGAEHYRARSAYKLLEIQRKATILRPGMVVVECGAAPGAWTQVATGIVGPAGLLVGCDLLPVEPVPGADLITGDFTSAMVQQEILARLAGRPVGCVLSDMAPNNPGQAAFNHDMTTNLVYSVLEFAVRTAAADSSLLVKMFAGKSLSKLVADLGRFYGSVQPMKPGSSRKESGELFLLARHLRPRKQ